MPAKRKSISLSKNIEGGDSPVTSGVTPQSPEDIAKRISKRSRVDGIYGPVTLISVVDRRLDAIAHHVLSLIAACSWDKPFCAASDEIASALGYSERSVIRKIQLLESTGYVLVTRSHNKRNEYSLAAMKQSTKLKRNRPLLRPCAKCTVNLTACQNTGWCLQCRKMAQEDKRQAGIRETERRKITA